jgi:hypothetical protein
MSQKTKLLEKEEKSFVLMSYASRELERKRIENSFCEFRKVIFLDPANERKN